MRDLDYYRTLRRPDADVNVGDEVVIVGPVRGDERWGRVIQAARVWITAKATAGREQRFRRDTQHDKDGRYRFATPAQDEFDLQVKRANKALVERRIDVLSRAQVPDGHLIAMADLLTELDQPMATKEA